MRDEPINMIVIHIVLQTEEAQSKTSRTYFLVHLSNSDHYSLFHLAADLLEPGNARQDEP